MAKSKNVTIRELKAAAKARGWTVPRVAVYRSPNGNITWDVSVYDSANGQRYHALFADNSRQGVMRMALAALRAK